jgi:hypothetical protein
MYRAVGGSQKYVMGIGVCYSELVLGIIFGELLEVRGSGS